MKRSLLTVAAAMALLAPPALAQDLTGLTQALRTALLDNDAARALKLATELYARSNAENDHETAGFAAYARAGLLERDGKFVEAAKSYQDCSDHYERLPRAAQSIQCEYKSALAFLEGYQTGRADSALKSAIKRLEAIDQDESAFASKVYLTLAEETLPSKLDHDHRAQTDRLKTAQYADKSMTALKASGQENSRYYAAAAFVKGKAMEDAERFQEAVKAYGKAVEIYQDLPDRSDQDLRTMQSRLSIARFGAQGKNRKNTIRVATKDGRSVDLTIERGKPVRTPKMDRNRLVDGARASAQITLADDGSVAGLTLLESVPGPEFGAALETGLKTWIFIPPDGVSPSDITPFNYSMVFYVKRL